MSWSAVVEFPAVDATAGQTAAWIAAAEADGDWWDVPPAAPWLDLPGDEVTPAQLLSALAMNRVPDVTMSLPAEGSVATDLDAAPAAGSGGAGRDATDADAVGDVGDNTGARVRLMVVGSAASTGPRPGTADQRAAHPAQHGSPDPNDAARDGAPAPGSAAAVATDTGGPAAATSVAASATTSNPTAADAEADCEVAGAASAQVEPAWIDPDPGPAPAGLARWVRREWWSAPIRAQVRALMTLPPGPQLAAALTALGRQTSCPAFHGHPNPQVEAADPIPAPGSASGWPCACQLIIAAAWHAIIGWADVSAAAAIIDLCGPAPVRVTPPFGPARATDPARTELAAVLRLAKDSTDNPLATARDLHSYPALAELAADGTVFSASRRIILTETINLSAQARARVIDHVVEVIRARRVQDRRPWTPSETRTAVRAAILALAEDEVAAARDQAYQDRRVAVTPDGDGMAWFSALITDVDAHRILNRLNAAAAATKADNPNDERTAHQRRADILTTLLLGTTPTNPHSDSSDHDATDDQIPGTETDTSDDAWHADDHGEDQGDGHVGDGTAPGGRPDTNGDGEHVRADTDPAPDAACDPEETDHPSGHSSGQQTHDQGNHAGQTFDQGDAPDGEQDTRDDHGPDGQTRFQASDGTYGSARDQVIDGTDGADHSAIDDSKSASLYPNQDGARPEGTGDADLSDPTPDGNSRDNRGRGCPTCVHSTDGHGSTGPIPVTARPDINVTTTLATLLGLRNDPAHIPGLGPVPADVARAIAADGRWRLWITDPATGQVITTGARTYTPSAALARLIRAREPSCRAPGCNRQAAGCDLDHTAPWPAEPGTVPENLGPLCRHHHNLKTHHGYHLEHLDPPSPAAGTDATTDSTGPSGAPETATPPAPPPTPPRWRWTFPSGLTHTDQPDPPLPGP